MSNPLQGVVTPSEFDAAQADLTQLDSLFKILNIYDKNSLYDGFTGPDGAGATTSTWGRINIAVEGGKKLSIHSNSTRIMTCFYDTGGLVVAGGDDTSANRVLTIPANATSIRVSALKTGIDSIRICYSDTMQYSYYPFGYKAPSEGLVIPKDYTTTILSVSSALELRAILDSITDASETNRYIVTLASGIYDISACYTSGEIEALDFAGLYVPDFVKLYGIGNREDVYLKWDSITTYNKISTLNLYLHSELENLTVYAHHLRYAVHDDWVSSTNVYEKAPSDYRVIKNCHFIGYDTYMGQAYGSGYKSGCRWRFIDCIFESQNSYSSSLYMHNNFSFETSALIEFDNCWFKVMSGQLTALTLKSLTNNTTIINYLKFIGCRISEGTNIVVGEDNAPVYGAGILTKLTGYANNFGNIDVSVVVTDSEDYSSYIDLV